MNQQFGEQYVNDKNETLNITIYFTNDITQTEKNEFPNSDVLRINYSYFRANTGHVEEAYRDLAYLVNHDQEWKVYTAINQQPVISHEPFYVGLMDVVLQRYRTHL